MRLRLLALIALTVIASLVVVLTRPGRQLTGELGLTPDPPFSATLAGRLYDARTLHGRDGAPDIGLLTADARLEVAVRAADAGGIARVQLRVDEHPQRTVTIRCAATTCPARARAQFTPRVVARGLGAHRVTILAGASVTAPLSLVSSFTVNVGAPLAAPVEVEPRTGSAPHAALSTPRPAVDRTIRTAARHGVLAALLGRSRLVLRERGRGAGVVTVLADIRPARANVVATLLQTDDDGGSAIMHARWLRDLVIDVDVRHHRILGVQPGPASALTAWTPSTPTQHDDDEAPSTNFTPRRIPRLLRLSDRGPAFFTQDGDPVVRRSGRDWPVSFLFTGRATVQKVKAGLRRLGLTRGGHPRYLGYRGPAGALRFDGDRGLKTTCDTAATDLHARVYAPSRTDRFVDPDLGDVVVATVHLDHTDGCGSGPPLFGFSERAERRLATLIQQRLHWRVQVDAYPLGNAEPLRRDAADTSHVWLSDGRATGVTVP